MNGQIPLRQVLSYALDRTLTTYDWLEIIQKQYSESRLARRDASDSVMKMRILSDAFSVYLTTLVTGGKNKHLSLMHCFPEDELVFKLKKLDIVKACHENRHNRSAHEADTYGHFVSAEQILGSDIKLFLTKVRVRLL